MATTDMAPRPRVGFAGLDDIGTPMAQGLIPAGFPVMLRARRAAGPAPFRGAPFTPAAELAQLGRASDVVGVCVFDEADVREVVLGDGGLLSGMPARGGILVHSTVAVRLGQLAVLVGGPVRVFEPGSGSAGSPARRRSRWPGCGR